MARTLLLVVMLMLTALAQGQTRIAVASNFEAVAQQLSDRFFDETGERLTLVAGDSGSLSQQLRQEVGFDAFIGANHERIKELLELGVAVEGSDFVFARGRLVLLADEPENEEGHGPRQMLEEDSYRSLAIPNERQSAYGKITAQALDELIGSRYSVRREVQGNSANQTFQFMSSGSVNLGFVPLSLVKANDIDEARYWTVPSEMHEPLEHAAVLLNEDSQVAREFLDYLQSDEARQIILDGGYE